MAMVSTPWVPFLVLLSLASTHAFGATARASPRTKVAAAAATKPNFAAQLEGISFQLPQLPDFPRGKPAEPPPAPPPPPPPPPPPINTNPVLSAVGYVGSSVTGIVGDLVELQVVKTQLALTHTRDATVASVRAAPQRAGAAIQAVPTQLGDVAGEWLASRQAAAAAVAEQQREEAAQQQQVAQRAAQQAAAVRAQQAEEEARARMAAAQAAVQEKEAAVAQQQQRFRSLPRRLVGKAKAAVLVPPLLAVEAALESVGQVGRAGADAQAQEVAALEIFTLAAREDGWDDVRDLIKEREPAYRQLQDYAEPATTLLATAAAEDGRVLLRAKAKAAVLVPPLTLTANALDVVSDVGAATVVAAQAAAVAAEAGAAAAAAGADSISARLGPISDYPVFTMQPREDGWDDVRGLIKEREPAYRQLQDYAEPATTLLATAAAEDGRVLLRAKAKAAVLVPPLTLTANALDVVSDVGAATVVAAQAAAVAAEAGAAAAAAGADSISARLGPISDYPVFTMQPREDGWNDARDLIKEREPAFRTLMQYLQPRLEATSRASKLAARWAVVITEEVVLPLLGPLGVWLRTVPQLLQDAASGVGQRLQGDGPGGRNSFTAKTTKRKARPAAEGPAFSRRFAEWRRGVVESAGDEPSGRRFAWSQ